MLNKKKFIVVNPFGIGDVLFTTPIVRSLKESFKGCFVGYLCNQRTQSILLNNPWVDKVFALSRGDLMKIFQKSKIQGIKQFMSLWKDIKKYKFDVAIDLSLEHRYALMLQLLGIKKRVGFDYKKRGRFLTEKIKINGYRNKHIVEHYLGLLKTLDIPCRSQNLEIYLSDEEKEWAYSWFRDHKISSADLVIGICPGGGASWGKQRFFKLWDIERFVQLSDRLVKEFDAKIIVFGDKDDHKYTNILESRVKYPVVSCSGRLSLREFISLISGCKLAITNDGGSLHLAVALGVKTVSIFGPVDDKVYGPYPPDERRHQVVKTALKCQPCYKNFIIPDCDNRKCLDIDIEEVYSAAKRLIEIGQ